MMNNRIGIFLFFDENGIVDDYICYMLEDMTKLLDRLVIVCNGLLTVEGRNKLEKYTKEIMIRENRGYDFCAWKEALVDYIGFNRLKEYDQLVLFNDSFFGPLYSFKKVFEEMEPKKLDFWGLSVHGEVDTVKNMCPYGYRPRYLQTYFLVVNKRMMSDISFKKYWESVPVYKEFIEVSEKISAVFTKYFGDLGFSWGSYSDTSDLETDRKNNLCHHAFNTYELIANRNYPIIKRKSFVLGQGRFSRFNDGNDLKRAVKYIEDNYDYDLSLIYKHICRRYDIKDIKESINIDFIVNARDKNVSDYSNIINLMIFVFYHENVDYFIDKINRLGEKLPGEVYVGDEWIQKKFEEKITNKNIVINLVSEINSNNYVKQLFESIVSCEEKEYYVIWHDFEMDYNLPITLQKSLLDLGFDNLIGENGVILNQCIKELEENDHIGMVVPPKPWFGPYFQDGNLKDVQCVETFRNMQNLLGTRMRIPEFGYVIGGLGTYVIRKEVVDHLRNLLFSDASICIDKNHFDKNVEKYFDWIVPYITQSCGLLTAECSEYESVISEREALRSNTATLVREFGQLDVKRADSNLLFLSGIKKRFLDWKKKANSPAKTIVKKEVKIKKVIEKVEVPVLVEIGLKKALINYIKKIFGKKEN